MPLTFTELLSRLPDDWGVLTPGSVVPEGADIRGIAENSRSVEPGYIFVAHGGRGSDGHRYIGEALDAGALAIVGERPREDVPELAGDTTPYWQVSEGRRAFALLSAAYFDFPAQRMIIVGVTGTDGKTTTSTLIHSILNARGLLTGLITTIAARIGKTEMDTGFHTTTPEAFELQRYLAQMESAGCRAVVVETTSHALDQERVAYIDYDVAVVTNVTHEHLDWHGSWDNYMAAKAKLFWALTTARAKPGITKTAVLNREDKSYAVLSAIPISRVLTYALDPQVRTTLGAREIVQRDNGTAFTLVTPAGEATVLLNLVGQYNVANALAAAGAGLALGATLDETVRGLEMVAAVRGRMEFAYRGDFDVVIDFAHTPNALTQAIATARSLVQGRGGRVIIVFGSAGLRDVRKRHLMGEEARAADISVLTAEDPRTEDVDAIIDEIAGGLTAKGATEGADFYRVPDRAEAIAKAVALAQPGDIVLTCGKSHERSMAYGTTETPWDEFAAVHAALAARYRTQSPPPQAPSNK